MAYPDKVRQRAIELYKGCSAAQALEALRKEFPQQDLPHEREIRRWRNKKLLEEHLDSMARIAALLVNGLDVTKNPSKGNQFDAFEYTIWNGDSGFGVTREWLGSKLAAQLETVEERCPDLDRSSFLPHIIEDFPEVANKGLAWVATTNPYELFQTLKRLATEKSFKGTCPLCKHWQ